MTGKTISAFLLIALGSYLLWGSASLEIAHESFAASDSAAVHVACTDPAPAAFIPDMAFTITWAAPAAGAASAPGTGVLLTGAVNGDPAPSPVATLNPSGGQAGHVLLTAVTPKMKLAGLQCQNETGLARLQAAGDGADHPGIEISFGNLADSDGIWSSADQVDQTAASTPIFGFSGAIVTQAGVSDGELSDDDAALNGEIVFGTTESRGGSEMKLLVDVTDNAVTEGDDNETLTLTLTGS